MELCATIVTQYDNSADKYVFLDNCEKRVTGDPVALALCKITRGGVKLQDKDVVGMKVATNTTMNV